MKLTAIICLIAFVAATFVPVRAAKAAPAPKDEPKVEEKKNDDDVVADKKDKPKKSKKDKKNDGKDGDPDDGDAGGGNDDKTKKNDGPAND